MKQLIIFILLALPVLAKPVKYKLDEAYLSAKKYDYWVALEPVYWQVDTSNYEAWIRTTKKITVPQKQLFACYYFHTNVRSTQHLARFVSQDEAIEVWEEAVRGFEAMGRPELANVVRVALWARDEQEGILSAADVGTQGMSRLKAANSEYNAAAARKSVEESFNEFVRANAKAFYFQGTVENPKAD